jgi:hypothetical protein
VMNAYICLLNFVREYSLEEIGRPTSSIAKHVPLVSITAEHFESSSFFNTLAVAG